MRINEGWPSAFRYYPTIYFYGGIGSKATYAVWDDYTHIFVTSPSTDNERSNADARIFNDENRLYVEHVSTYVGEVIDITGN